MDTPVDSIEKLFGPCGHQRWGFMIYRTTYTSEVDFRAMVSRIKDETAKSVVHWGADERPIVQQLVWTTIEDRDRLDRLSKADVRRTFEGWVQSSEAAAEQPHSIPRIPDCSNARYRYAVQIDQPSLDSFTKEEGEPFVNLIMRKWPWWPEEQDDDDADDEEEGDEDEGWEPIDGSREEDVGWCRVGISVLVPSAYSELCHPNAWYNFYQRPPAVV